MPSETSRIEAFSDGIFSIAATLLVIELKPPNPALPFWQGMLAQWPAYASFLLSFLFIGIMWINHHRLFGHVRRSDDALMAMNLILLLGIVWIPYPTLVIAQSVGTPHLRDAAILYNTTYLVQALLFNLLLFTCIHRKVVDYKFAGVQNILRQFAIGPAAYILCLALTWWSVPLSLVLNGAIALYYLVTPERALHGHQV